MYVYQSREDSLLKDAKKRKEKKRKLLKIKTIMAEKNILEEINTD